jgi:hypothetical protein
LSDVRRSLPGVDWTFVNAPHPASGPAAQAVRRRWPEGPFFEWWNATEGVDGQLVYAGAEATLRFLDEELDRLGPFDLLVGYSQGSALAAVVTARALRSGRFADHPWRTLLFNTGPPPRDKTLRALFDEPLRAESIHVPGGTRDFAYAAHPLMLDLWQAEGRMVLEHSEGHVPPSKRESPLLLERLSNCVMRAAQ